MTDREEFEAWYDAQPDGRINPYDVWQAATAAARKRMEKHCAELSQDAYNRWLADGNPYDDGQCDAANFLSSKIRSGE